MRMESFVPDAQQSRKVFMFEKVNKGYNSVFQHKKLTIDITVPIENYTLGTIPSMKDHLERVKMVEQMGFKAIWVRDVPFNVPAFGDVGQMFDPFTYLGFLAAHTSEIALATGSIILPLHHPVHVFKSAVTIDQLSGGRLILGVGSGDRQEEFPAMQVDFDKRDELFRASYEYIRSAQESFPTLENNLFGNLDGQLDILPKSAGRKFPILVTGHSRQTIDWIGENADGWMYYPRNWYMQEHNIQQWQEATAKTPFPIKPFMQPVHIDLMKDPDFEPLHIHLGFKLGVNHLKEYLNKRKEMGVNHVGINLRFNTRPIEETLEQLAKEVLPDFH